MSKNSTELKWENEATQAFEGKVVKRIIWLSDKESEEMMWDSKAPVIEFTDGSWIMASSDDEGNSAGALFTSSKEIPTIPVM